MNDSQADMTPEQLYFMRIQFALRVHKANGQAFQDLFVSVMTKRYPNFRPIKPQGSRGDEGNDGYIPEVGRYFQVYAPEKPAEKITNALRKAKDDFGKILRNWNEETPVLDYRFVFNDKFSGAYPEIEHVLTALKREHELDVAKPFLAKDLEAEFFALSPDDMAAVLGGVVPRAEFIGNIDYAALTEVLQHLVDNRSPLPSNEVPQVPDFESKIQFNDIGAAASYLKVGNYQDGAVEQFFNEHGEFSRRQIRDLLAQAYETAREQDEPTPETVAGDRIFFRLLAGVVPIADRIVQDAAIVLISYFFEKCDVFEDPTT